MLSFPRISTVTTVVIQQLFNGLALGMAYALIAVGYSCLLYTSYTHAAAAALRMKDSVMQTVTCVQENAADILASAKDINEQRAAQETVVEDMSEEAGEA